MKDNPNCEHGYQGACCCNCKHNIKLFKYELDDKVDVYEVIKEFGYACTNPLANEDSGATFTEHKHGVCELYEFKRQNKINL